MLTRLAARVSATLHRRRRGLDYDRQAVPVTPKDQIPPDEGDRESIGADLAERAAQARKGGGAT